MFASEHCDRQGSVIKNSRRVLTVTGPSQFTICLLACAGRNRDAANKQRQLNSNCLLSCIKCWNFPHQAVKVVSRCTSQVISGQSVAQIEHQSSCAPAAVWLCFRAQSVSKTFYRRLVWRDLAYWQLLHWPHMATQPIRQAYGEMQVGGGGRGLLPTWQPRYAFLSVLGFG
jgi:hypothetical protein